MRIFIAIDDTDNHDSMGSGQLAELLTTELRREGRSSWCSTISRHQLYYHESIPYTSHNSSMCFAAEIEENAWHECIRFSRNFLRQKSAPGSDPGLSVAPDCAWLNRDALVSFGFKAKQTILTKEDAYDLAAQSHVHLSENGGTGDGVIGALAGIGLRLHGSDGRVRGWLSCGKTGDVTDTDTLLTHPSIDAIIDTSGQTVASRERVLLADNRLKTVLHEHRQVLPVVPNTREGEAPWRTLDKKGISSY